MAKKVIEGYLAKQVIKRDGGSKRDETLIGVGFSDWDARELIERHCEYYTEQPFEYEMSHIQNGIAFTQKSKDVVIMYTYEKVDVISEN